MTGVEAKAGMMTTSNLAFFAFRIASKNKSLFGLIFIFIVLGYVLLAVGIHRKRSEETFNHSIDHDYHLSGEEKKFKSCS